MSDAHAYRAGSRFTAWMRYQVLRLDALLFALQLASELLGQATSRSLARTTSAATKL